MGISPDNDRALKNFSPSIISEPNYSIFEFLYYEKESKQDTIFNKKTLLDEFNKFMIDDMGKKNFQQKKKFLETTFLETLKKLNTLVLGFVGEEIVEFDWIRFDKLYTLLRHIKKSDERKIQWAIYHLFSSGQKNITMEKLNESLASFKITNLLKLTKNIVEDAEHEGMKISINGSQIMINHKITDPIVKMSLADQLEFYSRRSRQSLQPEILDLLDEGAYSNQEISEILDTDKSQISKAMKKLEASDEIKFVSTGTRGSHYYTTNCSNCPFGTNSDSCRKESISYIISVLEKDFGLNINENELDQVKYNQSLLHMKRIMMMTRRNKTTITSDITEKLSKIYASALKKSIKQGVSSKSDSTYANLEPFLEKTPFLYDIGFRQGSVNGVNFANIFLGEVLSPYLKNKKYSKQIQERLLHELKKFKAF